MYHRDTPFLFCLMEPEIILQQPLRELPLLRELQPQPLQREPQQLQQQLAFQLRPWLWPRSWLSHLSDEPQQHSSC